MWSKEKRWEIMSKERKVEEERSHVALHNAEDRNRPVLPKSTRAMNRKIRSLVAWTQGKVKFGRTEPSMFQWKWVSGMPSTAWCCAQGCWQGVSNDAFMIFNNLPRHKYLLLSPVINQLLEKQLLLARKTDWNNQKINCHSKKRRKYHETEKKNPPLLLNEGSGDPWREHRDISVPTPGVNMAVEKPGHRIISVSLAFAFKLQLMFLHLKKYFIPFNLQKQRRKWHSSQRTLSSSSLFPLQKQGHNTCFNSHEMKAVNWAIAFTKTQ